MPEFPEQNKFRRTQLLVDRGLQLRFTKLVLVFVFIGSVLTGLAIFYTTFMMLGERLADVYPQGRLMAIFRSVHIVFFISMLLVLPAVSYLTILFSHRIVGPLPKIYQALQSIGSGNFDIRLTLRRHDELKGLVDAINETARNLKARELRR